MELAALSVTSASSQKVEDLYYHHYLMVDEQDPSWLQGFCEFKHSPERDEVEDWQKHPGEIAVQVSWQPNFHEEDGDIAWHSSTNLLYSWSGLLPDSAQDGLHKTIRLM